MGLNEIKNLLALSPISLGLEWDWLGKDAKPTHNIENLVNIPKEEFKEAEKFDNAYSVKEIT